MITQYMVSAGFEFDLQVFNFARLLQFLNLSLKHEAGPNTFLLFFFITAVCWRIMNRNAMISFSVFFFLDEIVIYIWSVKHYRKSLVHHPVSEAYVLEHLCLFLLNCKLESL